MNRREHLLCILAEECAEVAQRCSKALRFTLDERQPLPPESEQPGTNADRIVAELADLIAVYEMLRDEGALPDVDRVRIDAKKAKVERFLTYSADMGALV